MLLLQILDVIVVCWVVKVGKIFSWMITMLLTCLLRMRIVAQYLTKKTREEPFWYILSGVQIDCVEFIAIMYVYIKGNLDSPAQCIALVVK